LLSRYRKELHIIVSKLSNKIRDLGESGEEEALSMS